MIVCINYRIIICINNNNAVINNNYGKFQDLTLLFKIPMGMQKNLFKICRQFGHMPSKRFTSPGLVTLLIELSLISICIWTLNSGGRRDNMKAKNLNANALVVCQIR
jgi:hypothetical protein